ncbi:MAG: dockerin type I repeat-containing protein [Planctomycetota bacterium]
MFKLSCALTAVAAMSLLAAPCYSQGASASFAFPDREVPVTGTFFCDLAITNDTDLQGFQTSITWDHTQLEFLSVTGIGTDAEAALFAVNPSLMLGCEPYEFFLPVTVGPIAATNRSRQLTGVVFDFVPPFGSVVLAPGTDMTALRFRFESIGGALGATTDLLFDTAPGDNSVIVQGLSIIVGLDDATLTFSEPFLRGDTDGDGTVNLVDAILVLNYLFNNGVAPTCLNAADANDDATTGMINTADAVYILSYLFNAGATPPAPFGSCGADPTPSPLSCGGPTACP